MLISCILEYARTKTLTLTLSRFSIKSWLSDYGSLISHKKKQSPDYYFSKPKHIVFGYLRGLDRIACN